MTAISGRVAPSITNFSVLNPEVGEGVAPESRAWFSVAASGTLQFTWNATAGTNATDFATLTNAPGASPPPDTSPFNHAWNITGGLNEGSYNPTLTVQDVNGDTSQSVIYVGIDRTGPSVGTPSLSYVDSQNSTVALGSGDWMDGAAVDITGLNVGVTDYGGVGVSSYQAQNVADGNGWQDLGATGSGTLNLTEGQRTLQFRSVDSLGNAGTAVNFSLNVDWTLPNFHGWTLPEVTTSTSGNPSVSFVTTDADSGIDAATSNLQYGFDLNGSGTEPDDGNGWLNASTSMGSDGKTMTAQITGIVWGLKGDQYLMLRATMVDTAGNQKVTSPVFVPILPGVDISWNSVQLDRLVIRTGSGQVFNLVSTLASNEPFADSVDVVLQIAPADRDSAVAWTTMSTQTMLAGGLIDQSHQLDWSFTVTSGGQWDVRLVIDPTSVVPERDENNNERYLVVSGADGESVVGVVPGFAPSLVSLGLLGLAISAFVQRRR